MDFRFAPILLLLVITATGCAEKPIVFDETNALEKQVSGERAFDHVKTLVDFGPRPNGSQGLEESRKYIEAQLTAQGWSVQRQTFSKKTLEGTREFTNLRARFGEDRWSDSVSGLLCSHYDTKLYQSFEFVGANDGGSSTGLLLELAEVLRGRPELATKLELVFFDGEEAFGPNITQRDGLYGSRHYATELLPMKARQRPNWGVLLDMVGDRDLKIRAGIQIPGAALEELAKSKKSGTVVDIGAVKSSLQKISQDLLQAAEDLGFRNEIGISPDYIVDDHIPLNVIAGIPTIDLIDFDYSYWHTPGDSLDKISSESLEISGRVTLQLVEKYLMSRE